MPWKPDKANRLKEVSDPLGHLVSRTYPDSVQETFEHDTHGNHTVHTDANSQTRTFIYDALDRLVQASRNF